MDPLTQLSSLSSLCYRNGAGDILFLKGANFSIVKMRYVNNKDPGKNVSRIVNVEKRERKSHGHSKILFRHYRFFSTCTPTDFYILVPLDLYNKTISIRVRTV